MEILRHLILSSPNTKHTILVFLNDFRLGDLFMSCELQTAKMEMHTLLISTRDIDITGNVPPLRRNILDWTRLVYSFHHFILFLHRKEVCLIVENPA